MFQSLFAVQEIYSICYRKALKLNNIDRPSFLLSDILILVMKNQGRCLQIYSPNLNVCVDVITVVCLNANDIEGQSMNADT